MLEFEFLKLSYTPYFEKTDVRAEIWYAGLKPKKNYKINDFLLFFLSIIKVLLVESSKFSGLIVRNRNI